jgi:hypothetical protein
MFKRIFDLFKRDKPKQEQQPQTSFVVNPTPKDLQLKENHSWISRWVRMRKRFRLQKDIAKGLHVSKIKSPQQPLRHIRPLNKFYSSTGWMK